MALNYISTLYVYNFNGYDNNQKYIVFSFPFNDFGKYHCFYGMILCSLHLEKNCATIYKWNMDTIHRS
jgi:hypothetical protein